MSMTTAASENTTQKVAAISVVLFVMVIYLLGVVNASFGAFLASFADLFWR